MWPFRSAALPAATGRSPSWRHLGCRPTRLGMGVLAVAALLWLAGVNYQVNLAYAAAFWLTAFMGVAVLMNMRQLLGMQIDVAMPQEVFAGGQALLQLSVPDNVRTRWLWLANEDEYLDRPSESAVWQPWQVRSGGADVFAWRIAAVRRGYLRVPPLRTAAVAPFGLTMVQCVWHWPSDAVVYPAPIAHEWPPQAAAAAAGGYGRPWPDDGDWAYLQPHQAGTPWQHVAWKSYAKTGELSDKKFEHPVAGAPQMVLSYLDYPADTPQQRLAGLLCHRVLAAERHGAVYTLHLPDTLIEPQAGQREKCLTALALW
ncbi:hypothetical protein LVJ83_12535 [Uruburuella testudinis]|uniref:DUF58 domain-containing protein n=1 Tax=Uruburuella testudinis TaxID=1282863 RepID=A0ABY4DT08_9NEIS|nr:hypothetical protein [Uruburuella testudinis]UOO81727.1 hypothetical protein LVJ83_12535 [Uruburuella testudinis]